MADPRATLIIILLLLIFFSPDQPVIRYHSQKEQERLRVEKAQDFDALANSSLGDLPSPGLNLTGFRPEDGYQWEHLITAQTLSRYQHEQDWKDADAQAPVYHDVDGEIKGDFTRNEVQWDKSRKLNLTALDPSTEYVVSDFDRNVTDATGSLSINLEELEKVSNFLPREIKASLSIYADSAPGAGWDTKLRGIHFPSGSIILTTSSRKFNALPALPHFTSSKEEFARATAVMNSSLTKIWEHIDQGQREDSPLTVAPKCELIVWLRQKPLAGGYLYIEEIEDELRNPEGAPIGSPPLMAFSAVVFSPDCAYILEANAVYGPKAEVYTDLYRRLMAALCLILVLQILLIKRQMEKCATPSTRSRVSYHTFGIAAFGDGLVLFALIGLLVIDLSVFLLAGAAAFLCCVHVAFLEVKFIFDIWTVQVGDPANAERERQRRVAAVTPTPNSSSASTNTPSAGGAPTQSSAPPRATTDSGLPLPATAPTPDRAPTIILTADQDNTTTLTTEPPRPSFASLYSRFYFALLNLMFFSLWATSWPARQRHIYFNTLAFCFFSLWLPQIYRNIMRNCRKALSWEYVLGTSTLRAVPVLYWYVDDRNILSATTNPRAAIVLLAWISLQILVLLSQQFLGPRILVPDRWCPPAYDYHPVLYDDLEAGGLPIGEVTSASEGKDASRERERDKDGRGGGARKLFDCAICMNEIDVPVVSKDEKKQSGTDMGRTWLEQRKYMVTPCRHIFHSECLEGWMNLRLVCPVCREGLPPL